MFRYNVKAQNVLSCRVINTDPSFYDSFTIHIFEMACYFVLMSNDITDISYHYNNDYRRLGV